MQGLKKIIRRALSPLWLLENKMNIVIKNILQREVKNNTYWLDVGCGLKPFASSFNNAQYIGIDIEVSGRSDDMKIPDKYFDGINIPFKDNTFDGVLCTQVLEHVDNLDMLLAECNRVIKMGGSFVVSVPFLFREHEQPYDFRRFTSYGLISALERNGFQVSLCLKCLSSIETIATIFSVYVNNNIGNKNKFLFILSGLFITFPALILSMCFARILPDNKDLFCVLISNAVKKVHIKF
jgi:SAM-dependent methyltransferase